MWCVALVLILVYFESLWLTWIYGNNTVLTAAAAVLLTFQSILCTQQKLYVLWYFILFHSCLCVVHPRVCHFPLHPLPDYLHFYVYFFFGYQIIWYLRGSLTVYSLIFILISFGVPQLEAPSQVSLSMLGIELAKGTDTCDVESCVITKITLQTCSSAFRAICVGNGHCRVFALNFASRISEFSESAKWYLRNSEIIITSRYLSKFPQRPCCYEKCTRMEIAILTCKCCEFDWNTTGLSNIFKFHWLQYNDCNIS